MFCGITCIYLPTMLPLTWYRACLSVSRAWHQLLQCSHDLWLNLDTRACSRSLSLLSLRAFLRRSKYKLRQAIFSGKALYGDDQGKLINYLLKTCKNIESVEFKGGFLGDSLVEAISSAPSLRELRLGIGARVTIDTVSRLLSTSAGLKVAEFGAVHGRAQGLGERQWPDWPHLQALETLRIDVDLNRSTTINIVCRLSTQLERTQY